jgi:hypothetical protein
MRALAVPTTALLTLVVAGSAHADFRRWDFTFGQVPTNPAAGRINTITTEFDADTNRFLWDVSFDVSSVVTRGFWLAVSPGPNPKGHPGELAIMYFDATNLGDDMTVTPKLTIYNYNGIGNSSSFFDGSPTAGTQAPDRIFSSLDAGASSSIMQLSATDTGNTRRFVVELDASIVQNHTPLYPNPQGDDWTGLAFGSKIGVWFSHFGGLNTAYGTDPANPNHNYLTQWSYTNHGWLDGANFNTQLVPTPGALALVAAAGLLARRRR